MSDVNPNRNLADDEFELQNYQDDLDTDADLPDLVVDEEIDDPIEDLGLDPDEFKEELEMYALDEAVEDHEGGET